MRGGCCHSSSMRALDTAASTAACTGAPTAIDAALTHPIAHTTHRADVSFFSTLTEGACSLLVTRLLAPPLTLLQVCPSSAPLLKAPTSRAPTWRWQTWRAGTLRTLTSRMPCWRARL